jgi:Mitochondrial K+-H+ exchange-related
MQVFLIPIGRDRYEPYFEPIEAETEPVTAGTGWFGRLRHRFAETLREAEAERHRRHETRATERSDGMVARWQRRSLAWIVERAAEQRLLWHLRTADSATLHAPDDLTDAQALDVLKTGMKRDADRHRVRFAVHFVLLLVAGAFFFIPGPNVIGYFFTFTTVGHWLAWRGATNGLGRVAWTVTPSAVLRELRLAEAAPAPDRESRVRAAAEQLGLRHLATFVSRLAIPPA